MQKKLSFPMVQSDFESDEYSLSYRQLLAALCLAQCVVICYITLPVIGGVGTPIATLWLKIG